MRKCDHPRARVKRYLGSTETYSECPDCWETWGGQETPQKKALLTAAARYEDISPEDPK